MVSNKKSIFCATLLAQALSLPAVGAELLSVVDLAPQQYTALTRNTNFYANPASPANQRGALEERRFLLGDMGGVRTDLASHGILFDAGLTQSYQKIVSGQHSSGHGTGSADIWLSLDTGRAGLWSGGLIVSHAEIGWGNNVSVGGAVLPTNFDTTMPHPGTDDGKLSELYLFQALPDDWGVMAGKVAWTSLMDKSLFANDERNQFMYTGLNNNAILALFVPYTSLGAGVFKQFNHEWAAGVVLTSNSTDATSSGFDDFDSDKMTLGASINWSPVFADKPGLYSLLLGCTNKDVTDLRHVITDVEYQRAPRSKSSNQALAVSLSQYLWVAEGETRFDGQPVGFGPFLRAGVSPDDRSVIDQFYSVGVGGTFGLFGRNNDSWGVGWAATHYSSYLRDGLEFVGGLVGFPEQLDAFEHGVEAYYSIALTPAVRLTINSQYLDSPLKSVNEPALLGARLQIDL